MESYYDMIWYRKAYERGEYEQKERSRMESKEHEVRQIKQKIGKGKDEKIIVCNEPLKKKENISLLQLSLYHFTLGKLEGYKGKYKKEVNIENKIKNK